MADLSDDETAAAEALAHPKQADDFCDTADEACNLSHEPSAAGSSEDKLAGHKQSVEETHGSSEDKIAGQQQSAEETHS